MKTGDKVSIVVNGGVYPATVLLVVPAFETVALFVDPYLSDLAARYPTGIALEPRHEGKTWCAGHEGSAVNALRTVTALSR